MKIGKNKVVRNYFKCELNYAIHHVKECIMGNEKDQANGQINTPYISMF